jgi:hypothetical protein
MIVSWMLYSLLVSALVAAAAWVLEEVCRLVGRPVRWVWLGALAATLALVALAPLRATAPSSSALQATVVSDAAGTGAERASTGALAALAEAVAEARELLGEVLGSAVALGGRIPGEALAAGWMALSAALLVIAGATILRAHGARRRWPLHELAGTPVRVAPRLGPAVLGLRAPEVVVPRWVLEAPPEEQRLVVLHEREHIRARDPLLLAAGCLAAALVPWNPAAWWMLSRLRTAVELDCDARVLRRGVRPFAYGTLLIDMAGRGPGLTLGAPAMAGSPSSLERRLRAMNVRIPRFAPARAGLLGVLAAGALVGACSADLPTSAEVERMDVAAVEKQATHLRVFGEEGMTYVVDGKPASAEEARAIPADRIVQIEVKKQPDGTGTVAITTGESNGRTRLRISGVNRDVLPGDSGRSRVMVMEMKDGSGERMRVMAPGAGFDGLVVIDGQIVSESAFRALSPDRIEKIEVVKGPRAAEMYPGNAAATKGVIRITTKR